MDNQSNKPHVKQKAGKKVERKKENKFSNAKKSSNPKAFTFQSSGRAEKTARRNNDLGEKKLHVPMVDRTPLEAPPVVIAVVGPPGVSCMNNTPPKKKKIWHFHFEGGQININSIFGQTIHKT